MRFVIAVAGFLVGIAVGACIDNPHKACHDRAVAKLGCCPFCADDCQLSNEEIEEACEAELGELEEEDEPPPAESGTPTPAKPNGPNLPN